MDSDTGSFSDLQWGSQQNTQLLLWHLAVGCGLACFTFFLALLSHLSWLVAFFLSVVYIGLLVWQNQPRIKEDSGRWRILKCATGFWLVWTVSGYMWGSNVREDLLFDPLLNGTSFFRWLLELSWGGFLVWSCTRNNPNEATMVTLTVGVAFFISVWPSSHVMFLYNAGIVHIMSSGIRVIVYLLLVTFFFLYRIETPISHPSLDRIVYVQDGVFTAQDLLTIYLGMPVLTLHFLLAIPAAVACVGTHIYKVREKQRKVKNLHKSGHLHYERICVCTAYQTFVESCMTPGAHHDTDIENQHPHSPQRKHVTARRNALVSDTCVYPEKDTQPYLVNGHIPPSTFLYQHENFHNQPQAAPQQEIFYTPHRSPHVRIRDDSYARRLPAGMPAPGQGNNSPPASHQATPLDIEYHANHGAQNMSRQVLDEEIEEDYESDIGDDDSIYSEEEEIDNATQEVQQEEPAPVKPIHKDSFDSTSFP